jgi:hypothetical protein
MPLTKMLRKPAACLLLFPFFACHTTLTKVKTPEFTLPLDSLLLEMNEIVVCEHVNMDGREVMANGKVNTELEIDIINGKNINLDNGPMKNLAHKIAFEIKEALKNTNEYENYTVLFVKVESSAEVTTRTWKGQKFKSSEL